MGESRPVPSTLQHPVITKSWRGHQGIAIGLWWVMGVRGAKPSRPFSQDGYPLGLPQFCGDKRQMSRGHHPPGTPGADRWATHPAPGAQSSET